MSYIIQWNSPHYEVISVRYISPGVFYPVETVAKFFKYADARRLAGELKKEQLQ